MTFTAEIPAWGGLLFFRPETASFRGRDAWSGSMAVAAPREIPGPVAGCPGCGWSGAPTILREGLVDDQGRDVGPRSTFCPACESPDTAAGEEPLLVAMPEDVFGRGPWARLKQGALYRPRPAAPVFHRERLGTVTRIGARVGRNDPCPCESGKKWKRCCGRAAA